MEAEPRERIDALDVGDEGNQGFRPEQKPGWIHMLIERGKACAEHGGWDS